jgi:PPK2 family polyphosphate:nucleotide phosphotransferase
MNPARFRVQSGERRPLSQTPTDFVDGLVDKAAGRKYLETRMERLVALQHKLYATSRYAMLVILQGMDTAGKDSAIEHVFSGFNPQSIYVHSFKQPSSEELSHDFLWKASRVLPQRGNITVFNRSYYEEVIVVRVHPELLEAQRLPKDRIRSAIWEERFEDIRAFERHLWRSGTIVVKFFLNISRGEQERRLLDRIEDPTKNWKFSPGDLPERAKWNTYMKVYSEAIAASTTRHAPWYVIPADHKWFAHAAIAQILHDTLSRLDLRFPSLTSTQRRELRQARRELAGKGRRAS